MAQKPGSRSNEDPPQQTAHNVHWARTQRPGSQTRCWLEMLRTVTWRWFSGIRRWRDWTSCSSFSATRRPRSLSLTHRWRCSALQQIPPLVTEAATGHVTCSKLPARQLRMLFFINIFSRHFVTNFEKLQTLNGVHALDNCETIMFFGCCSFVLIQQLHHFTKRQHHKPSSSTCFGNSLLRAGHTAWSQANQPFARRAGPGTADCTSVCRNLHVQKFGKDVKLTLRLRDPLQYSFHTVWRSLTKVRWYKTPSQ